MTGPLTDEQIVARTMEDEYPRHFTEAGMTPDAFWAEEAAAIVAALRNAGRLAEPEYICGACEATTRQERSADLIV